MFGGPNDRLEQIVFAEPNIISQRQSTRAAISPIVMQESSCFITPIDHHLRGVTATFCDTPALVYASGQRQT